MSEATRLADLRRLEELRKLNALLLYKPYPKQRDFHALGAQKRERCNLSGNQLGKAQAITEPVLTPSGWRAIGALRRGDAIIAGDGSVTTVNGVYPQGIKKIFRVSFDDGVSTLCCEEHLWAAKIKKSERFGRLKNADWPVYSLKQILEFGGENPSPIKRAVIPVATKVDLQSQAVAIDPYLLGLLLGDGSFRHGITFSSIDEELVDYLRGSIGAGYSLRFDGRCTYHIVSEERVAANGGGHSRHEWRDQIRNMGLYGKLSHDKFVPKEYLWNSHEVRLAVLQGLMDTDGSIAVGGAIEYSTCSLRLADDVTFLSRSLGGKVKREVRQTSFTYKGEKKPGAFSYRLRIRLPHVAPFRLKRKVDRLVRPVSTTDHRVLYSIREAGESECVCISVAHPSKTYITRDFIVTHNTLSAGAETAYHLTGHYPDWWQGKRFVKPVRGWVAGVTGETTRDNPQRILMGPMGAFGTGMIPKDRILKISLARGTPDAVENVLVRHESGGTSQVTFKSYADGRAKWQGESLEFVWYDEEPEDEGIYSEGLTRTNTTGGIVYATMTPLLGMSKIVRRFYPDQGHPDRGLVMMTIDDVLHYTEEEKRRVIEGYLPHERDARAKGIPLLGEGAVYPIGEDQIAEDPISVPAWWPQLVAMDFGWHDHPTAAVRMAWDRDTDCVHVTRLYKQSKQTLATYAAAIRALGGDTLPVSWPHDGLQHDKSSAIQIAQLYRQQGVKMLSEHAQFPDDRKNGVEAAVWETLARMQTNRLRVDKNLAQWFEEFRNYHRKDGKIVAEFDDLMKATHYGLMMLRHAVAMESAPQKQDRYTRRRGAFRAHTWMAA